LAVPKTGRLLSTYNKKTAALNNTIPDDLAKQSYLENAGAVFADFDGDGDQDLIIGVGGNADEAGTPIYFPRFYENDGKGNFHRERPYIPAAVNASVIVSADYDGDGHPDLFIGGRSVPGFTGVRHHHMFCIMMVGATLPMYLQTGFRYRYQTGHGNIGQMGRY
jgi:hypothetical protein